MMNIISKYTSRDDRPFLKMVSLLFCLCAFVACKKEPKKDVEEESTAGIYVAGEESRSTGEIILKYWKDNKEVVLVNGFSDSMVNGSLASVFVTGSDVYFAGSVRRTMPIDRNHRITLWKNGKATYLSDGTTSCWATSVFVSNEDVYVLGRELLSPSKSTIKLWKNGVSSDISGEQMSYGSSLFVSGTDVYVSGIQISSTDTFATLWKNGKPTSLSDGSRYAFALSVYVSGTDVYVAGTEGGDAILWKNGVASKLASDGSARSVCVYEGDVYVAGSVGNVATLWKNGVATKLGDGTNATEATSVFVKQKDVYVAGMEFNSGKSIVKLWKNGLATNLSDGKESAYAFSLFVK